MTTAVAEIATQAPVDIRRTTYLNAIVHEQYITMGSDWMFDSGKHQRKPIIFFLRDEQGNEFPPYELTLKCVDAFEKTVKLKFENAQRTVFNACITKREQGEVEISIAFHPDDMCMLWALKLKDKPIKKEKKVAV